MKRMLLISPLVFFYCITLSAQLELMSCDTINYADEGQCFLSQHILTNVAISDGTCSNDTIYWEVLVDTWLDGYDLVEYSSSVDATDTNPYDDSDGNGINDIYLAPSLSGEEVSIFIQEGIELSSWKHSVAWKSKDACGNEVTCYSLFEVNDDQAPILDCPEEYIIGVEDYILDLTLHPQDIIYGVSDNCTHVEDLVLNFSSGSYNGSLALGYSIKDTTVTVFAFDENNNFSQCSINIDFVEQPHPYTGYVFNVNETPLSHVEVNVNILFPDPPSKQLTNESGEFVAFVSKDFDYSIQAKYNDNLRGLSTRDIILIEEYISDNSNFDSPYDIIASDVNHDFVVNEDDVNYLRSLLFGNVTDTTLWKFLYASLEFDDIASPFPYEEGIEHVAESEEKWNVLLGIKLGDVNHSALEEALVNTPIEITAENIKLEIGEEYAIDFFLPEGLDVRGFQFSTMNAMSLSSIESSQIALTDTHQNVTSFGRDISWNGESVIVSDQPFLTAKIVANNSGELVDQFEFIDNIQAEIYVGDNLEIHPLQLNVTGEVKYSNELFNVVPNPFNESTNISFELAKEGIVQLNVVDAMGRQILNHSAGLIME